MKLFRRIWGALVALFRNHNHTLSELVLDLTQLKGTLQEGLQMPMSVGSLAGLNDLMDTLSSWKGEERIQYLIDELPQIDNVYAAEVRELLCGMRYYLLDANNNLADRIASHIRAGSNGEARRIDIEKHVWSLILYIDELRELDPKFRRG